MSHPIQSLLSLDENEGLYYIETNPIPVPSSPESDEIIEKKPKDILLETFKSSGRYFEDPNPLIKCFNCNQYGHMSGTCPNPSYKFRCNCCGEQGHTSFNCKQVVCHRCYGVGHKINQCRSDYGPKCEECRRPGHKVENCLARPDTLSSKEMITVTCLNCREIGHANCFRIQSYSQSEYCSKCGEKGHIRYECGRK